MENKGQKVSKIDKSGTNERAGNSNTRRSPGNDQPIADSKELRPVFAAYFNMARANLYSVLRYISAQCGLEVKQDEDSMHELAVVKFANYKHPEVRQKVFSLLMRHIPVLQQMTQAKLTQGKPAKDGKKAIPPHLSVEQQDVQQTLQDIIRVVNFQRNRFTHADHYDTKEDREKEINREKALFCPLETAFKGSKREVKRIFCYTAADMKFVDQEERMKRILMKDSAGNVIKDDKGRDQYIFVEHADWYFRLFNTTADPITNMPKPDNLTTAGLVFLLCKLLHKRYATQLSQQSGLFRTREHNGHSPFRKKENEVMFNIFCAHRIRLPKGRVESTAVDTALGLDMLSELQKCPPELFDTLSPNDRKLFQLERKDGKPQSEPDDDINLFRRNGDRFPLLALRFIDTMRGSGIEEDRILNNIVFQVALGKFRHTFYNRFSLDTNESDRLRVLQKEINGFGPINKVEEFRKTKYAGFIRPISDDPDHLYDADTADTTPYLTDHHTTYAITGDRIGITWNALVQKPNSEEKRNSIRLTWKDEAMEKLNNDKCFLPNLLMPTENIPPRAWLSVHDLLGLIFLHMIGGNPEAVIMETYSHLVKLLNDINEGKIIPKYTKEELETLVTSEPYCLYLRDVPKKLVDYLLGNAPQNESEADKLFNKWVNRQLDGYTTNDDLIFLLKDIKGGHLKPHHNGVNSEEKLNEFLRKNYHLNINNVPQKLIDYLWGHLPLTDKQQKKDFNSWVKRQLKDLEDQAVTSLILRLEKRISKFESDLKQVGDKQNRIGRKGYVDVRPGSLARYISKDIMFMTRPDENRKNNGKPSGLDFGVLQSAIATYKGDGNALEMTSLGEMMKQAINVNNHPFLSNVMKLTIADAIDLYRQYQKQKLDYFIQLRKGTKGEYKDQWFLREAYRNHIVSLPNNVQGAEGLAARYLDTLQLPDGLFTNAIRTQLANNDNTKDDPYIKAALADENKGHSAAYLFKVYFTHILNDKPQPFYRNQGKLFKRHYNLLDWTYFKQNQEKPVPILPTMVPPELYYSDEEISTMLRKGEFEEAPIFTKINNIANRLQQKIGTKEILVDCKIKEVPDYGEEGSASDKAKDAFFAKLMHQLRNLQRNERNIRRYRNQDMLLFLMAKKILLSGGVVFKDNAIEENGIEQFKLQDILPPAMKLEGDCNSLLEQPIEFSLTIGLCDESGKPITDANGKQIMRTIHQDSIKLKNYGDFFAFLYDSRIGGLLSQLSISTDDVIDRADLEKELDSYDRKRLKVFAVLQAIERRIIDEHPELADSNADGQGFFDADGKPYRNSFSGLLSLCKQYLAKEDKLNDLGYGIVDIRNAFSHNRYTSNDNKKINISKMNLPQVAELILKWLENHE